MQVGFSKGREERLQRETLNPLGAFILVLLENPFHKSPRSTRSGCWVTYSFTGKAMAMLKYQNHPFGSIKK
jgi:hypothetical protein